MLAVGAPTRDAMAHGAKSEKPKHAHRKAKRDRVRKKTDRHTSKRDRRPLHPGATVFTREDIERLGARDLNDLLRYVPGVTRFGGGRITLRGR